MSSTRRTYRSKENSLQRQQMKNMAERVRAIEQRAFDNFKKKKNGSHSHSKLMSKLEVGFKYNPKLMKQKADDYFNSETNMPLIHKQNKAAFITGNQTQSQLGLRSLNGSFSQMSVYQQAKPIPATSMNTKLNDLKQRIHLRKIQTIERESAALRQKNEEFNMREQNILLNAL